MKDPETDPGVLTETSCSVEKQPEKSFSGVDVEKNHFMKNFHHFDDQGAKSYEISVRRGRSYEFA